MEGSLLLAEYLKTHKLTLRAFADKVKAPFSLVWRWVQPNSKSAPGVEYALAIEDATGGVVPLRSWAAPRAHRNDRPPSALDRKAPVVTRNARPVVKGRRRTA